MEAFEEDASMFVVLGWRMVKLEYSFNLKITHHRSFNSLFFNPRLYYKDRDMESSKGIKFLSWSSSARSAFAGVRWTLHNISI